MTDACVAGSPSNVSTGDTGLLIQTQSKQADAITAGELSGTGAAPFSVTRQHTPPLPCGWYRLCRSQVNRV